MFHELARRRESKIEEGHLMPDHVHMFISIPPNPPKYSVDEETIRAYIKNQELQDREMDQLALIP